MVASFRSVEESLLSTDIEILRSNKAVIIREIRNHIKEAREHGYEPDPRIIDLLNQLNQ